MNFNNPFNTVVVNQEVNPESGTGLPKVTPEDAGKTLVVDENGQWIADETPGGGGGITDVQVNGTSVVTDGVANIPEASAAQAGVVTTGNQTFSGVKNFTSSQINIGSGNTQYKILTETSGLTFQRTSTQNTTYKFKGKSSQNVIYVIVDPTGRIRFVDTNAIHDLKMQSGLVRDTESTLPAYSGTLMSAPSTWSEGVNESATLPSAGTYQINYGTRCSWIVCWDGSNATKSSMVETGALGGQIAQALISGTGVISVVTYSEIGGVQTKPETMVYFRKIGIA